MEEAIHCFPNAVSLSLHFSDPAISDVPFFECLGSFPSLKRLKFSVCGITLTGDVQPCLRLIPQLIQLDIDFRGFVGFEQMLESLKCLTTLTKLGMRGNPCRDSPKEPYVELENIRNLRVGSDLFADQNGKCFFPSLTNLTRLELATEEEENQARSTKAIGLYSSSLVYLRLAIRPDPAAVDFVPITSVTKLETLEFTRECMHFDGFLETLKQLQSLTRLIGNSCFGTLDASMRDSIATLAGLKELDFFHTSIHDRDAHNISIAPELTRLTKLTVSVAGRLLCELGCLKQLARLELEVFSLNSCSLDDALPFMSNPETLFVLFRRQYSGNANDRQYASMTLSSNALAELDQLQSLSLVDVNVDKLFFRELASKTRQTRLELDTDRMNLFAIIPSQVNMLKGLSELTLIMSKNCEIWRLLSPQHLSNLKRLNVMCSREEVAILSRKFERCPLTRIDPLPWGWYLWW